LRLGAHIRMFHVWNINVRHLSRSRDDKIYMNKYHIQIGQLFVCIAKYMHMHFRCLFYNMKILYTKSKVSEHSGWSRAARQPAKSRMRFATTVIEHDSNTHTCAPLMCSSHVLLSSAPLGDHYALLP